MDILSLLQTFDEEMPRIERAYSDVVGNKLAMDTLDIDKNLIPFIEKCETLVDSDLTTLQTFIVKESNKQN
jgi:hypothetical protein